MRRPETARLIRRAQAHVDRDFYTGTYSDVAASGIDPAEHFVRHGWREGRDPNALFSTEEALRRNPDLRGAENFPLIHLLEGGSAPGTQDTVLRRFAAGPLAEDLAAARALEPMLDWPRTARRVIDPREIYADIAPVLRRLRTRLTPKHLVIAVPGTPGAGLGHVATTLAGQHAPGDVLTLLTGGGGGAAPETISDTGDIVDLGPMLRTMAQDRAHRICLDILRGTGARCFLTLGCPLSATLLRQYGRQLAQEMKLVAYLPPPDTPAAGAHPDLRFYIDALDLVLTGDAATAAVIRQRFGLRGARDKVQTISGPASDTDGADNPDIKTALARITHAHDV
jgi:hypothetical protein